MKLFKTLTPTTIEPLTFSNLEDEGNVAFNEIYDYTHSKGISCKTVNKTLIIYGDDENGRFFLPFVTHKEHFDEREEENFYFDEDDIDEDGYPLEEEYITEEISYTTDLTFEDIFRFKNQDSVIRFINDFSNAKVPKYLNDEKTYI